VRYPVLSTADASIVLAGRRAGTLVAVDRLVKSRGDGPELNQEFVRTLQVELGHFKSMFPEGVKSQRDANRIEGEAALIIHRRIAVGCEVLGDPDFWLWLAVVHFGDLVEWRYGNPTGGAALPNYGIGARSENFLYRLWLRAELVLDDSASDRYHLCRKGQIDFYRSHLFRQGFANTRAFARALLRYQYPNEDGTSPRLKVGEIRELVKRLRRLRSNLFLEILGEEECRRVIEGEVLKAVAGAT
jgi:hypothetical protein